MQKLNIETLLKGFHVKILITCKIVHEKQYCNVSAGIWAVSLLIFASSLLKSLGDQHRLICKYFHKKDSGVVRSEEGRVTQYCHFSRATCQWMFL